MNKWLLNIPTHFETERLCLRAYQPGDGAWYYEVGLRNREHLARYEAGNALMALQDASQAELVVRDFANCWQARNTFFLGAFSKLTNDFVAQIYIGAVNWDLPEFELGYIADKDHQGQGYVTEAAQGALRFIFDCLCAERVRLECDDTNIRSYRVAERCRMNRVAHVLDTKTYSDGSHSGTLHYQLSRPDYLAMYGNCKTQSR
jgi:RimJ/RimL family protein N-acetyltransferase